MKLNWFSPLPPARTDIAHYTQRLLPALAELCEVTLWTDQRSYDSALEKFATVRKFRLERMPWRELNHADMSFYQIGNNPDFHGAIWQVSRLLAGVVVLHDLRLHHFFDGIYRVRRRDLASYLAVMSRYYGPNGRHQAAQCYQNQARNIDYMAEHFPLTEFALEDALGVIVHTADAFEQLNACKRWPLAYAPLPFPSLKPSREAGIPSSSSRCRLVIFGYIGKNRRLGSVLKALSSLAEKDQIHLDVYGTILDDERELRSQISNLNLKNQVSIHGYTAEAELDEALSNADLAINLRFPTMGEASGSQLRIWSHCLPSLVSDIGWYSSLPEGTVALVRTDENEVADIEKHLRSFLARRDLFAEMGAKGRQELEKNHSPENYAQSVVALAQAAMKYRPVAAHMTLAERAARAAAKWTTPEVADENYRRVAKEILAMAVS